MKSFSAHLRSVRAWGSSWRASKRSVRAGAVITLPDGSSAVLPKDWAAMSIEDLAAIGNMPGDQPDFFIPDAKT